MAFIDSETINGHLPVRDTTIDVNIANNATISILNSNTTLSFGTRSQVMQTGTTAASIVFAGGGTIDNLTTIASNGAVGSQLIVGSNAFQNDGQVNFGGGTVALASTSLINKGTLNATALVIGASTVSNAGAINVTNFGFAQTQAVSVTNFGLVALGGFGPAGSRQALSLANSGAVDLFRGGSLLVDSLTGSGSVNLMFSATLDVESAAGMTQFPPATGTQSFSNNGFINLLQGASLSAGAIAGNGMINIGGSATLDVQSAYGTIVFQQPTGTIKLETTGAFGATLLDFRQSQAGDAFDQIDLVNQHVTDVFFSGNPGFVRLAVLDGPTTVALIDLSGADYTHATFNDVSDGAGGTFITTTNTACFVAGTRIRTKRGDVAVEDLRESDLAVTERGIRRPIVWIGRSRIDLARHPSASSVAPIRVRANAFGPHRPQRDLLLSPDHAVFVRPDGDDAPGVLVAIRDLVNGRTIVAEVSRGSLTYYHVELDRHDVLLAEGLPTESYLDTGNRAKFANCGVQALFPTFDGRASRAAACAKFLTGGSRLEAVIASLDAHAADSDIVSSAELCRVA